MPTLDPAAGTAGFVMTANGYKPKAEIEALMRAEADALRKQEHPDRLYV
jgi:hypothetical protein